MDITEILRRLFERLTLADIVILVPGFLLLATWLYRTSLGTDALADSVPRRNNMPLYVPLVPWLVLGLIFSVSEAIKDKFLTDTPEWQIESYTNLAICLGSAAAVAVTIHFVRKHFARGMKGFGLRIKTIPKDLGAAVLNLIAIGPMMTLALQLTLFVGMLIYGTGYKLGEHEKLQSIAAHSQLQVQVLVVITTVIVAPIFEELLFRGLLQSLIGSLLHGLEVRIGPLRVRQTAWVAIIFSSALFALPHMRSHWPAIFVLGLCLGYAYEKSGSLLRPIFIHMIFNAIPITTAILKTSNA